MVGSISSTTFVMEQALRIKRSFGLTRCKNDKVDARIIALYAYEKRENLTPTILPRLKMAYASCYS
jgi:hypothetical protein